MNSVWMEGKLGADMKIMGAEGKVGKLTVALSSSFTKKDGTVQDITDWVQVTVFGKLVQNIKSEARKGATVRIRGEFKNNNYQGKDGKIVYNNVVNAKSVVVFEKAPPSEGNNEYAGGDEFTEDNIPF